MWLREEQQKDITIERRNSYIKPSKNPMAFVIERRIYWVDVGAEILRRVPGLFI